MVNCAIWMNESKNSWREKYLSTGCVKLRINVNINVKWDKEKAGSLSITSVQYRCIINVTINAESETLCYPWWKVAATRKKDKWEKINEKR